MLATMSNMYTGKSVRYIEAVMAVVFLTVVFMGFVSDFATASIALVLVLVAFAADLYTIPNKLARGAWKKSMQKFDWSGLFCAVLLALVAMCSAPFVLSTRDTDYSPLAYYLIKVGLFPCVVFCVSMYHTLYTKEEAEETVTMKLRLRYATVILTVAVFIMLHLSTNPAWGTYWVVEILLCLICPAFVFFMSTRHIRVPDVILFSVAVFYAVIAMYLPTGYSNVCMHLVFLIVLPSRCSIGVSCHCSLPITYAMMRTVLLAAVFISPCVFCYSQHGTPFVFQVVCKGACHDASIRSDSMCALLSKIRKDPAPPPVELVQAPETPIAEAFIAAVQRSTCTPIPAQLQQFRQSLDSTRINRNLWIVANGVWAADVTAVASVVGPISWNVAVQAVTTAVFCGSCTLSVMAMVGGSGFTYPSSVPEH